MRDNYNRSVTVGLLPQSEEDADQLELTAMKFLKQIHIIMSPEELIAMMDKHLGVKISFPLAWNAFVLFRKRQEEEKKKEDAVPTASMREITLKFGKWPRDKQDKQ